MVLKFVNLLDLMYLLNKLRAIISDNKLVGLYQDDGLGVFPNLSGPETEESGFELKPSYIYRERRNDRVKDKNENVRLFD